MSTDTATQSFKNPWLDARPNYSVLRQLGLSPLAVECYELLCEHGGAEASAVAGALGMTSRHGAYRPLAELVAAGFADRFKIMGPTIYSAWPLNQALARLHARQRTLCNKLIMHHESSDSRFHKQSDLY